MSEITNEDGHSCFFYFLETVGWRLGTKLSFLRIHPNQINMNGMVEIQSIILELHDLWNDLLRYIPERGFISPGLNRHVTLVLLDPINVVTES